ncbi:14-3-3 brain family protein [Hibiscus syriacus]|uniref:Mannosyltransferase n=1 Tax=Hibiscus syriacus TaxID=106335 RepID=A0A6A2ZJF0_HIBSY|nr:14-3-3 brain family protein [Hibiscus syriacus]
MTFEPFPGEINPGFVIRVKRYSESCPFLSSPASANGGCRRSATTNVVECRELVGESDYSECSCLGHLHCSESALASLVPSRLKKEKGKSPKYSSRSGRGRGELRHRIVQHHLVVVITNVKTRIIHKGDKPGRSSSNVGEESGNNRGLAWFTPLFALGMEHDTFIPPVEKGPVDKAHHCVVLSKHQRMMRVEHILKMHIALKGPVAELTIVLLSRHQIIFFYVYCSSQFALRSYLYIIFHEVVGRPASWLFPYEKVRVFYAVRLFLGLLSVISDATAVSRMDGKHFAFYALAMLCLASGCFFGSTSFLPSSFSMYAMSLSSGLFLLDKPAQAVTVAAVRVILVFVGDRCKIINKPVEPATSLKTWLFLYPVLPPVCLAASAVIESFPDLVQDKYSPNDKSTIVLFLHRFPSSYFVPDYVGEVRWINDGFQGLLPFPFNATLGGTSASPPYFNDKNKASYEQYLEDLEACSFLVELQLDRHYRHRGNDLSTWEAVAALPYLDSELSPAKYRSFFIPHLWEHKNVFGTYKLLKRISKPK